MLAFLLFGLVAARQTVQNAPAFVEDLQVESITGDARLQYTPAMYDLGQYLFQVAYGYLNADALPFGNLEAPEDVASFEVADMRIGKARDLLIESLRLDPADGYTWQFYAQSEAALSNTAVARRALRISKDLAPHTMTLALQRIQLLYGVQELSKINADIPPLTSDEREIYADDLRVLEVLRPQFLEALPRLPE